MAIVNAAARLDGVGKVSAPAHDARFFEMSEYPVVWAPGAWSSSAWSAGAWSPGAKTVRRDFISPRWREVTHYR